ncbi:MAG: hypothetical protein WCO82_03555, partial [Sphingomonadales bacterium]
LRHDQSGNNFRYQAAAAAEQAQNAKAGQQGNFAAIAGLRRHRAGRLARDRADRGGHGQLRPGSVAGLAGLANGGGHHRRRCAQNHRQNHCLHHHPLNPLLQCNIRRKLFPHCEILLISQNLLNGLRAFINGFDEL